MAIKHYQTKQKRMNNSCGLRNLDISGLLRALQKPHTKFSVKERAATVTMEPTW